MSLSIHSALNRAEDYFAITNQDSLIKSGGKLAFGSITKIALGSLALVKTIFLTLASGFLFPSYFLAPRIYTNLTDALKENIETGIAILKSFISLRKKDPVEDSSKEAIDVPEDILDMKDEEPEIKISIQESIKNPTSKKEEEKPLEIVQQKAPMETISDTKPTNATKPISTSNEDGLKILSKELGEIVKIKDRQHSLVKTAMWISGFMILSGAFAYQYKDFSEILSSIDPKLFERIIVTGEGIFALILSTGWFYLKGIKEPSETILQKDLKN